MQAYAIGVLRRWDQCGLRQPKGLEQRPGLQCEMEGAAFEGGEATVFPGWLEFTGSWCSQQGALQTLAEVEHMPHLSKVSLTPSLHGVFWAVELRPPRSSTEFVFDLMFCMEAYSALLYSPSCLILLYGGCWLLLTLWHAVLFLCIYICRYRYISMYTPTFIQILNLNGISYMYTIFMNCLIYCLCMYLNDHSSSIAFILLHSTVS